MDNSIKHYVEETMNVGGPVNEIKISEVPKRDVDLIYARPNLVCFRFFDRVVNEVNREIVLGEPTNYSVYYYYGKKFSMLEITEILGENHPLIFNMGGCGATNVVEWFGIYRILPLQAVVLGDTENIKSNQKIKR